MLYWVIMKKLYFKYWSVFIGRSRTGSSNTSDYAIGIGYRTGNQTSAGTRYNIHIGNDTGYNGGVEDYTVSIGYRYDIKQVMMLVIMF